MGTIMNMSLIDLPNLFNSLIRTQINETPLNKDYIINWLDLDLLSNALTQDTLSGIWVFHSKKLLGRDDNRLSRDEQDKYLKRLYQLQGVTTQDAGVPGEQNEAFDFECPNCKQKNQGTTTSEKGVDTALIAHLFDTIDHWTTAIIMSQDADYCPAVAAARRKGKMVIGAGVTKDAAPALVRECFAYLDIIDNYIAEDFTAYKLLSDTGLAGTASKVKEGSPAVSFDVKLIGTNWDDSKELTANFILNAKSEHSEYKKIHDLMKTYVGETWKLKLVSPPTQLEKTWVRTFRGPVFKSLLRVKNRVSYPIMRLY
jgi:uncharacterized LabA/DUF88 family protein